MPDVITLGELLIDFVPTVSGVSLVEAPAFQKAPGGAPANVAVGLARLGVPSGFMGKVGDDPFGRYLSQTLEQAGVDVSRLCYAKEARTALAFVSLQADGERDFLFYRHPSADMLYSAEDVDAEYIRKASIFHYGSISLISEPSRSATLYAIEVARASGLLVSYDPNLRLNLWEDAEKAKKEILLGWQYAQVIKVSQEELVFLSGERDLEAGADKLWHANLSLLVVTLGKEGCSYRTPDFQGNVAGIPVKTVDTTGAGDGFVAGLLRGLWKHPKVWETERQLREVCRYANGVGALTTTQRGAIPALPYADQVENILQANA